MRREEKRLIIIVILIGVVIIGGLLIWKNNKGEKYNENVMQIEENEVEEYVQKLEDGSKLNVSEELRKEKEIEGLEITNIQLKETRGITTLLAEVENTSGKISEEKKVQVEILNKKGEVITTLKGRIDKIGVGEKVQLNMSVTADVANAYDFRIREI